jgi:hypothetical protein
MASTVQQNRAEKSRERKAAKDALSGGKVGGKRSKRVSRNRTVGKGASLKSVRGALDRAKSRFT